MSSPSRRDRGHVIVIINTIRPYIYSVNNILGMPNGFTDRIRYRRRWIHGIPSITGVAGFEGLLVLRNFETTHFVPLRRIKISNVLQVGEVAYIEFSLGDIIDFDSDGAVSINQLTEFAEKMRVATRGFENKPHEDLEKLIFLDSDLAFGIEDKNYTGTAAERAFNSWGNLVQILGAWDCFTDFDFLKVTHVVDSRDEPAPTVFHEHPSTARFHLKAGTSYRLRVFQRTFTRREGDSSVIASRSLSLSGDKDEVNISQPSQSIAGKYDLYEFPFKTSSRNVTVDTTMLLDVTRDDLPELPKIEIPITITVRVIRRLLLAVSIVMFIAGVLLLFGSDQIEHITETQKTFLERLGILLAIVSTYVIGSTARALLGLPPKKWRRVIS